MHTTEWDSTLLRETLSAIMTQANLTQTAVGKLAGRDRTMANRWLQGLHRPTFEAATRFSAALRAQRPDLGDLLDQFMRAAGYETPSQTTSGPATVTTARQAIEALRAEAHGSNQSLGEVLIDQGLAEPDELVIPEGEPFIPDALPPDDIIEEINASDISEETKAKLIQLHLDNRARRFEEKRLKREKPDGT